MTFSIAAFVQKGSQSNPESWWGCPSARPCPNSSKITREWRRSRSNGEQRKDAAVCRPKRRLDGRVQTQLKYCPCDLHTMRVDFFRGCTVFLPARLKVLLRLWKAFDPGDGFFSPGDAPIFFPPAFANDQPPTPIIIHVTSWIMSICVKGRGTTSDTQDSGAA